jgi:NAD(P)-dependent dehydrogenase (short-subunit alcohol dehydrogenase family)
MQHELNGKTAVVTGAGRGIGLAIATALADEGALIVAGTRGPSPGLEALARKAAVRIQYVDLGTAEGPERLVAAAGDTIDVLVNNVGFAPARPGGFLSVTDEDWLATFTLNTLAAIRTTRAALPVMLAGGGGSIVTVSSVNAGFPDPVVIDYSAAKAALSAFSKALSKEVAGHGVRVNTISPGPVATDLWNGAGGVAETLGAAGGTRPEDIADAVAQSLPTGRFSRPDEVADLAVLLAGARSANITGADFRIDGGMVPTW